MEARGETESHEGAESSQMVVLDNISVILVRPIQGGNVGSVARAMLNLGFGRLKMIRPRARINLECRKMAGQAINIVEDASVFDSLETATASSNLLVATTSSRGRKAERRLFTPRQIADKLAHLAKNQEVGLVFGSERTGLSSAEMDQCQYWASIPSNPDAPVLNLAQAALLFLYEIRSVSLSGETRVPDVAPQREREDLYTQMQSVLVRIGFLSSSNPTPIMSAVRSLLARADLDSREVRILRGIMSHMDWYVREGFQLGPDSVRKP